MIQHHTGRVDHDGIWEKPVEYDDEQALVQSLIESGDTLGEAIDDGDRWPPAGPWFFRDITAEVSLALEAEREHRAEKRS